ncbi:hypothetical protein LTR36_008259 [Oleoguttula mirabilis]|uniref:Uncharacterized protein n=1 Tax=Oleoguttula mirabilis TaxID=1507867 RepID=A0AAV9J7Z2_9PEZI|nr:hypothetical protein LTR36_008259 [Oleoguttula mirabilis]
MNQRVIFEETSSIQELAHQVHPDADSHVACSPGFDRCLDRGTAIVLVTELRELKNSERAGCTGHSHVAHVDDVAQNQHLLEAVIRERDFDRR